MSVFGTRKKRLVALVAVTAAVAIGSGVAYAYWTAGGTGVGSATTGQSTDFVVASTDPVGDPLVPGGGSQTVTFTVTNPAAGPQTLSNVTVSVAHADGTTWNDVAGCSSLDYAVAAPTITTGPIASGANVEGTVQISMNNLPTNQNTCKGKPVPLYIVAS